MKDILKQQLRSALVAIAIFAIAKNILEIFSNNEKYSVIIFALSLFSAVFILPILLEWLNALYAIVTTGLCMLLIDIVGYTVWIIPIIILITVLSDKLINEKHMTLSIFIFDTVLSAVSTISIRFFETDIISLIILSVMFGVVLVLGANFFIKDKLIEQLCNIKDKVADLIKKEKTKTKHKENPDENELETTDDEENTDEDSEKMIDIDSIVNKYG